MNAPKQTWNFQEYPLLDALRDRRSRRFGLGMKMETGPLAYQSQQAPICLTEEEEAVLAFAACGITGYALGDLSYEKGQGGTIMAGLLGRTIPSGDGIQAVSLFVTNDEATYLLKRPQDFAPDEIPGLVVLAQQGDFVELYRRSRVKIKDGRAVPPMEPLHNLDVNRWSLHRPGCSYFLPVNEFTFMYINGVLEIFGETTGVFIIDERAGFQPAGVGKFAKSKGGHLHDNARDERVGTIQQIENLVTEFVTIEQGMVLQNLALMTQALGLGGFPHWAAHPFSWFQALGFRMAEMPASRYLGMNRLLGIAAGLLGRDQPVSYPIGLEHEGKPLFTPYCPPYYPSMEAAVRAVVARKFGEQGIFRGGARHSAWKDWSAVAAKVEAPSEAAIAATIAYCEYVYNRYGRFPAYAAPFRTVIGFQANRLDVSFYDKHYRPEALAETQRQHLSDVMRSSRKPADVANSGAAAETP